MLLLLFILEVYKNAYKNRSKVLKGAWVDVITEQALSNITTVLQSFLPSAIPDIDRTILIVPSKIKPTGLGGFVGVNDDPNAALFGRFIEATSEVTIVSSDGVNKLQQAVSTITQSLLSQDRETLRTNGIFKLDLDHLSGVSHSGSGNNAMDSRTAVLNVQFEYIPVPVAPEGTIDELVYHNELGLAEGKASFFNLDFASIDAAGGNPLSYFDFIDDPGVVAASPGGNWLFDAATGYIEQTRNVRGGGSAATTAKKAGAQALVIEDGNPYLSRNLIIKAEMESGAVDGIGFVFRWIDGNNFYFYIMSASHDYHLLAKKSGGNYEFLQEGGLNQDMGYDTDERMEAKLIIENSDFKVYLNNRFVLAGKDHSIGEAGRVGFLSHRNSAARFYNISLIDFSKT